MHAILVHFSNINLLLAFSRHLLLHDFGYPIGPSVLMNSLGYQATTKEERQETQSGQRRSSSLKANKGKVHQEGIKTCISRVNIGDIVHPFTVWTAKHSNRHGYVLVSALSMTVRRETALVQTNILTFFFYGSFFFPDHPLETFKWPYSPFTSEFKEQHRARGKLAQDLRLAVQEIKGTNTHANQHLQDLDNRLQLSRQDLSTCLDEIQFRKSQLRDMSLMAVDIVKKLSRQPPSFMSKPSVQDGAESDVNGSVIPNTTGMSYVDHQMMDVDQESSGDDLSGSSHSPSLKGLNEGNVRSFLEKIRELEHAQRPLA